MAGKILIKVLLVAYYSNLLARTRLFEALLYFVNSVSDSSMNHIASNECPFELEVVFNNLDLDSQI